MNVFFIVLFSVMLFLTGIMLGIEISDIKNADEYIKMFPDIIDDELKKRFEMVKTLCKQNMVTAAFATLLVGLLLALNIWMLRDKAMTGLMKGTYGYEQVVRTKTKGDQVKVDTTYNFYRIKPEKK